MYFEGFCRIFGLVSDRVPGEREGGREFLVRGPVWGVGACRNRWRQTLAEACSVVKSAVAV